MKNSGKTSRCDNCKGKFDENCMLEGKDHTHYCVDCFKRRYCKASGDQKSKQTNDVQEKLIPFPEIFSRHRQQSSCSQNSSPSMMSLSKRPLQCPKADCSKFISLFTLESHFKYEHKEIPVILTQLDSRSALEFYPRDCRYGITQCIVLLNVIDHDFSNIIPQTSSYCSRTNLQTTECRPVMVLLATRIRSSLLSKTNEACVSSVEDDGEEDVESSATFVAYDPDVLSQHDKIIIWLASNIFTNLSYTVAASTLSNMIRQKYYGPMMTLGDGPMELCKEGTCLILTHFHINGMTENGRKPLALDIVIHSPD